jgi:hypothetical protein
LYECLFVIYSSPCVRFKYLKESRDRDKILVSEPEGKRPLGNLGVDGFG